MLDFQHHALIIITLKLTKSINPEKRPIASTSFSILGMWIVDAILYYYCYATQLVITPQEDKLQEGDLACYARIKLKNCG